MKWTLKIFLGIGILSLGGAAFSFPAPIIRRIEPAAALPKPAHHGLYLYMDPIADPNLTAFKVELSRDRGATWHLYSDKLKPYNTERLVLFFRGDEYAFQTEESYQLKLCAVYGGQAEECRQTEFRLAGVAGDAQADGDDDGLPDLNEYNAGTDPLNPDSDGDDMSDRVEFAYNVDPNLTQFPNLVVDEGNLAFGEGNAYGDHPQQHQSLVLHNRGARPLRIYNILIDSNPLETFQLADNFQLIRNIPPGARVGLPVDFLPRQAGMGEGGVTILSDDRAHFPYEVSLSGAGKNISNLMVHLEQNEIRFGETPMGGLAEGPSIPVTNVDSDKPLQVKIFTEYVHNIWVTPTQFEVVPDETKWVRLQFLPEWSGGYEGALRIQGINDSGFREVRIPLYAKASGLKPQMRLVAQAINFPATERNKSVTRQILIHNDGEGPLYIKNIDFGVGEASPFSVHPKQLLIAPGGQRFVDVTFNPKTNAGEFRTHLCLVSNDGRIGEEEGCNILRSVAGGVLLPREAKAIVLTGRAL